MDEVIQSAPVEEQQPQAEVSQPQEQQPHIESDPYESEAREQGWRPKEEFEGDPEKWRPAKEFVERGELFGKIDTLGKELKETKKALKMLQEHNSKVKETEFKRAVEELKSLQKKHLEEVLVNEFIGQMAKSRKVSYSLAFYLKENFYLFFQDAIPLGTYTQWLLSLC